MNQTTRCLTPDRIRSTCSGSMTLPPDELERIEQHLDECPACRGLLDDAAADPAGWAELRVSLCGGQLFAAAADEAPSLDQLLKLLGPTDDPRMLGRIGTYEIVGVLGRGGMGVVFKGFDAALNRYVAIKLLQPHLAVSGAARQRFAREAQAAAAVVHDNVMAIHSVAEWQGAALPRDALRPRRFAAEAAGRARPAGAPRDPADRHADRRRVWPRPMPRAWCTAT